MVPSSGFGRQGNPGRTRGSKPAAWAERIEAMKKADGLRHAADTYNYLFSSELKPPVAEILGVRATTRVTRIL